jgi:NitT/TauT family transport system substrate-binding protein
MRAFRNKTIDVAALTLDEVLVLAAEGMELNVFLVMDVSNGADAIVAQEKYESVSQLSGAKVGYENTAVGAYVLSRALKLNGLTKNDIVLVPMNVNETESALRAKTVDAVVTFEPAKSRLLESGFREIFSSKELKNEIVDVLVTRKVFYTDNEVMLKNLVDGWFETLEYYRNNIDEAQSFMNKRLRLPSDVLSKAFDGIVFPTVNENQNLLGSEGYDGSLALVLKNLREDMEGSGLIKDSRDSRNIQLNSKLINR